MTGGAGLALAVSGLGSVDGAGVADPADEPEGDGDAEDEPEVNGSSRTWTPGVPRRVLSYRFCSPDRPTSSPATTAPSESSTISLVACPTVPRMGRAKSRVGASICSLWIGSAPLIANTSELAGRASSVSRYVIASTNASSPAAATFLAYVAALMSTSFASFVAAAVAASPSTTVLSIPIRTTGRSLAITSSSSPSTSPRSAVTRRWLSRFDPFSWGSTIEACQAVFHRPASFWSWAVVVYVHFCGTPGNVQATSNVAVAADPDVSTSPTLTAGVSGPMPRTRVWNDASTSVLAAATNSTGFRSFLLSPAASSVAARSGSSPVGVGSPLVQPVSSSAMASSPPSAHRPRTARPGPSIVTTSVIS